MMHKLVGTCRWATEALERSKYMELSKGEKLKFKIHLGLCKVCAIYFKQDRILQELIRTKLSENPQIPPTELLQLKENLQKIWTDKK